ncbi:MAG: hypothetical protein ACK4YP_12535, partial [Myxococcota bacterium]
RFATTAERFGGSLDVGTAMEVGPEPGFGVIAIGLAPESAGPLVAALAVHVLAREARAAKGLDAAEAADRLGAAFATADGALAVLGGKGVVEDEEAAAALAAQGFSVPGRGPTSAVVRGPLCASAALVGCWGGAIVTAHVGDAAVWRGRGGQWGRVGLPHTLQQAYGASIPTGWEDEMTRVLGTGVNERGTVLVGEAREGDAWAITVGAGGHTRATRREGSGARVRVELGR